LGQKIRCKKHPPVTDIGVEKVEIFNFITISTQGPFVLSQSTPEALMDGQNRKSEERRTDRQIKVLS